MLFKRHTNDAEKIPALQSKLDNFQVVPRDIPAAIAKLTKLHQQAIKRHLADDLSAFPTDAKILNKLINYGHLDADDSASLDHCTEKVKKDIHDYKKFWDEKNAYVARVKEFLLNVKAAILNQHFMEKKYHIEKEYKYYYGIARKQKLLKHQEPLAIRHYYKWEYIGYYGRTLKNEWIQSNPSPVTKLRQALLLLDAGPKKIKAYPDQYYLDTFVEVVDIMKHARSHSKKPLHHRTSDFYAKVEADIDAMTFYPHTEKEILLSFAK